MKTTSIRVIFFCLFTLGLCAQEIFAESAFQWIKEFMRAVNTRMPSAFYTDAMKESIKHLHPNYVQALLSDATREKKRLEHEIDTDNFKQECLDASAVALVVSGTVLALSGKIHDMIISSNDITTKLLYGIIGGTAGVITICFLNKHDQLAQDLHDNKKNLKAYVALEEDLKKQRS